MTARYPLAIALAVVLATLTALAWSSAQPDVRVVSAENSPTVTESVRLTASELAALQAAPVAAPAQVAGVSRLVSESFESDPFPPRGSKWAVSDSCTSLPGQNDVIAWGRQLSESTVGAAGLWSVGGGSLGKALSAANKEYPTDRTGLKQCDGIRTTLLYSPMDFSGASHGMRVTFDYLSKMPAEALFIGAGDLDKPNNEGGIDLLGFSNFKADTGGEWEQGVHVELDGAARVKRVLLGIVYRDPPPDGRGRMSTGVYGVFIDNLHIDAKFVPNAGYIPSPTATPGPTDTPTRRPTVTRTPPPLIPSDTPTAIRPTNTPGVPRFFMPLALKAYPRAEYTPPPTAPTPTVTLTPTITPTPTPKPTDTPEPTETPLPTDTPEPTPTATNTPLPVPDVKIVEIVYRYEGSPRLNLEWVRLKNLGTGPQDLTRWRLFERRTAKTCRIPAGVVLDPEEEYQVRSGGDAVNGVVDGVDGFVCDPNLMWNNESDQAILYDDFNDIRDCRGYDQKLGFYSCN